MARRHRHQSSLRRIDGSLCDIPVSRLLTAARAQRITGSLHLCSWGRIGHIELRGGEVVEAVLGTLTSEQAMAEIVTLRDGSFQLSQHLPSIGTPASTGEITGHLHEISLAALLGRCRSEAITCAIRVDCPAAPAAAAEPVELELRGGEIITITRGNRRCRLDEIMATAPGAAFAITLLPVHLDSIAPPSPRRLAPPARARQKSISVPPPIPLAARGASHRQAPAHTVVPAFAAPQAPAPHAANPHVAAHGRIAPAAIPRAFKSLSGGARPEHPASLQSAALYDPSMSGYPAHDMPAPSHQLPAYACAMAHSGPMSMVGRRLPGMNAAIGLCIFGLTILMSVMVTQL